MDKQATLWGFITLENKFSLPKKGANMISLHFEKSKIWHVYPLTTWASIVCIGKFGAEHGLRSSISTIVSSSALEHVFGGVFWIIVTRIARRGEAWLLVHTNSCFELFRIRPSNPKYYSRLYFSETKWRHNKAVCFALSEMTHNDWIWLNKFSCLAANRLIVESLNFNLLQMSTRLVVSSRLINTLHLKNAWYDDHIWN